MKEAARILGLEQFLDKKPRALSGGQRQRVAMGRAIVRQPQAFLMDEPLSNLDAKLRVQMRAEISGIQRDLKTTTIYVTHDQVEAMTMGDRVAVIRKGELQQVASPQELYDKPVNLFVGGFIGSPAMNLLEATLAGANGGLVVEAGDQQITLDEETLGERPALKAYEGRQVVLGIRPEDLEDAELEQVAPGDKRMRARVELRGRRSGPRSWCTSRSRRAPPSPRTCASSRATSATRARSRQRPRRATRRWLDASAHGARSGLVT